MNADKGEDVVGGGLAPMDASEAAASLSHCRLLAWNLAALSLSRSVFFFDFFLDFLLGLSFSGGATCTVLGWPKNAEKLTKANPFIDSITSLDFLPDLQHLLNSTNVEKRKASSVKCL